jgi:TolA-binding protein
LAGFTRKPEQKNELMATIYRTCPADQLSAMLLAECGDLALQKGDLDQASAFFNELRGAFPKSDFLEYAYCGLGQIALAKNKPEEAVHWFDDAVEKYGAEAKLAQITYFKARALLALGKSQEAKKILEEVASNREWKGELTAMALISLGEIEESNGNTAGAIQYYQRVFVAYQRYPDPVIAAYLKAAAGFIKLNEPDKAAAHLREMLSKPKLAQSPRAAEAQTLLETLPSASSTGTPAGANPPNTSPKP